MSNFQFSVRSFLCYPIETNFRISSCEKDFYRIFFHSHVSYYFQCLTPLKRSVKQFFVNTIFNGKDIFLYFYILLFCLCCVTPLKRSLGQFFVTTIFNGNFFFISQFSLSFLHHPIEIFFKRTFL